MGQKINPIGLRVGINRTWESRWFAKGEEYGDLLHQDLAIRNFLMAELKNASVSRIVIERRIRHAVSPSTRRVRVWSSARRVQTLKRFTRRSLPWWTAKSSSIW